MSKLLPSLYRKNLISPKGIWAFNMAILRNGVNLMALLAFAAKLYPDRIAVVDEKYSQSYKKILEYSKALAFYLRKNYDIKSYRKVAIANRNHLPQIWAIIAVSGLGADLFLINPNMSAEQLQEFHKKHNIDLFILDNELKDKFIFKNRLFIENVVADITSCLSVNYKIKKKKSGNIVVLTGGTSGQIKTAARKPSIFDFLNPFFALLTKLDLDRYSSVYIAVPIFHGFGFSTLIISLLLGTTIYLTKKFETEKAVDVIKKYNIDVIAVVPLMIRRMLDFSEDALAEVKRIITGGAAISPELVKKTLRLTNNALFNLYGTSEAGFSVMATPNDLQKNPATIGKPIKGVNLKIISKETGKPQATGQTGIILLQTRWAMSNLRKKIQPTGDLGYIDKQGLLFLAGRADDMIVSGGENVYPATVENVLYKHNDIEQVAVVGVKDEEFGQRLKAFVVLRKNCKLTTNEIKTWLENKIARYEMPASIVILDSLPHTPVGKIDRKKLKQM